MSAKVALMWTCRLVVMRDALFRKKWTTAA
jgi:hypothetical protein